MSLPDLRQLYQETILDHSKRPRCHGRLEKRDGTAEGFNPLCGDRLDVDVARDGDRVAAIGWDGQGCAICTAAASMMAEAANGKSEAEIEAMFDRFHDVVTGKADPMESRDVLGGLAVFAGVRAYPMRVKCATLPWHTLRAALRGEREVSTE